jgi:hypothetical protein
MVVKLGPIASPRFRISKKKKTLLLESVSTGEPCTGNTSCMKLVSCNTHYPNSLLLINTQENFEGLMVLRMTILLFWVVTPCRLATWAKALIMETASFSETAYPPEPHISQTQVRHVPFHLQMPMYVQHIPCSRWTQQSSAYLRCPSGMDGRRSVRGVVQFTP